MTASIHESIRVAYETIPYVGRPFHETHPNRLLAVARLHGIAPPARERISVLEIGSGDGSNLLPIAAAYPRGRFVGVDLSALLTARARAAAEAFGVRNVTLVEADLRDLPHSLGQFDVVMGHGVYSWVPPDVRDGLLKLVATRLVPGGVAYLNYNLLPGGWLRRAGWEAMQFHVRGVTDPAERVARAREFIALLVETWSAAPGPGAALAANFAREAARDDSGIYHDDLAAQNEPVYYAQFVRHAAQHGLEVAGDIDPGTRSPGTASPAFLERIAARDPVMREQMLDFVHLRQMRQSLLVQKGSKRLAARDTAGLHFAASMPYMQHRLAGAATSDPVGDLLAEAFPAAQPSEAIVAALRARGVTEADAHGKLRESWAIGLADPYVDALAFVTRPSKRPRASAVSRALAAQSGLVTNLRHTSVKLADECARAVLLRCDGTRTKGEIAAAVRASIPPAEAGDPAAAVARRLGQLASAALFEA